jgi:phosphate transport system substrate-binding protein
MKNNTCSTSFLALVLLVGASQVLARTGSAEDVRKAQELQALRAAMIYESGQKPHYTRTFDLSGLPNYVPGPQMNGWIRLHGNNYMSDGKLGELWQKAFAKYQPGIRLSYYLPTSAIAFSSLFQHEADLVMGHKPDFYDLLAYQRIFNFDPTEITALSGSYDVSGWENSVAIAVHESNPLTRITLAQLDGIFGAERDGGWVGTTWHREFARGPEKNIRTWGQMGLKGAWANKPINPHGFALRYNTSTDFADRVLQGSDKWNERIRTYGNYKNEKGEFYIQADQLADALAKDKYGIAFVRFRGDRPGWKRLAVAAEDGKYIEHTMENVQNRSYPLGGQVYFYTTVKPGTQMDPIVKEFLRFVLSQEGQAEVQRDGKYLPLTATDALAQLKKLD